MTLRGGGRRLFEVSDDSTVAGSHCVTRGAAAAGGGLAANGALEFALAEDRSAPRRQGRVAQLVRALVSHTRGPGFESLRDHFYIRFATAAASESEAAVCSSGIAATAPPAAAWNLEVTQAMRPLQLLRPRYVA